ncbi:MAG: hypothetical protein JWP97_4935 [Labilithrix sp.]|nr:hypothetical protein [Labilithrix sp.]
MSKPGRDPRTQLPSIAEGRGGAGAAGHDRALESGTAPDEVPAVHVLQAAHDQDRKEAQELLSGFDRRGRGPQRANVERDFVGYFAKKSSTDRGLGPAPRFEEVLAPRQVDLGTRVKPREDTPASRLPSWLGWAGAGALMLAVGGIVAFLAILATDDHPAAASAAPAATLGTTAGETASPQPRDIIPPPAPMIAPSPEPAAITTTPVTVDGPAPRPARREARGTGSSVHAEGAVAPPARTITDPVGPATTAAPAKTAPRDDFIRDL